MRKGIAGMTALLLSMTVFFSGFVVAQASGYHEYEIEEYVMKELSAANVPGVSVSIVSDEKEIYSAAIGAGGNTESDFVLGSLTHSMTALGIMRMVEDGDVSLDDPVSVYLPQYDKLQGTSITLKMLLHQTSGIAADARLDDLHVTGPVDVYENAYANYHLLGEVIEAVSGETYEEYITENILDACEMTSTYSLRQNPEMSDNVAPYYQTYFGYPVKGEYRYKENSQIGVSGGYLLSDSKDMGRYLQMYLKEGNGIVQPDSIKRVLEGSASIKQETDTNGLFGTQEAYGMGWISTDVEQTQVYYQIGMLENHMSMMILIPEKKVGAVMLFNEVDYTVGRSMIRTIGAGVAKILLGQEPDHISGRDYLLQHGTIDLVLLLILIAAWMPMFLIGFWKRKVSQKFSVVCLILDIVIHLLLPTALLITIPVFLAPWNTLFTFVPDIAAVLAVVIGTLYLGAVVKLIQSVILVIQKKLHLDEETFEEQGENEAKEEGKTEEE